MCVVYIEINVNTCCLSATAQAKQKVTNRHEACRTNIERYDFSGRQVPCHVFGWSLCGKRYGTLVLCYPLTPSAITLLS